MKQPDQVSYKDFLIQATPWLLAESREWRGQVRIMRKNGDKIQPFTILEHTFKTKKEAVRCSLEYGTLIIDGRIPGCFIEDI